MVKQLLIPIILLNCSSIFAELPEEAAHRFKFAREEKVEQENNKFTRDGKFKSEFIKILLAVAPKKFKEAIEKAKDPNCPDELRVKRVLLHGAPGNGKTTLAKLVAQEMGVNFVLVNSSLLGTEYVNSVAQNLMKKIEPHLNRPCVILLDEADSILREATGSNDPARGVAQQVWQVLDDLHKLPHVIIFGTTNNIKNMPEPVQSRFSKHIIEIPYADPQTKKEMICFYLKEYTHECDDKFLSSFVEKCKDLSARDIENLVNGAKDEAYMRKPAPMFVTKNDLENSLADLLKNKKTMAKNATPSEGMSYQAIYNVTRIAYNGGTAFSCWWKNVGCELPRLP